MAGVKRTCDNCGRPYVADIRNLKRGWGLCCSKSCAASKREKSKPGYDEGRVAKNDIRRANWTPNSKPKKTRAEEFRHNERLKEFGVYEQEDFEYSEMYPDFDNIEM